MPPLKAATLRSGVAVQILLLHLRDQLVQLILVRDLPQGCHRIDRATAFASTIGLVCVCIQKNSSSASASTVLKVSNASSWI